ncbi:hypothetical protein QBC47DRAFT_445805 [Echria macrotheca]|uniref:SH3b domain-containing protein n=1 Tax=Echria macrotheca TaxID=438768 RepID=A0AAJ0BC84_9PEZI|nr:hypothetical protein QBC47DRAFT_445805 [Echria macrotheca]
MNTLVTSFLVLIPCAAAAALSIPPRDSDTQATAQTCRVEGTVAPVNCRGGAGRAYPVVGTLEPGEYFSVGCTVEGEGIDGESAWGYVSSLGCWVSIRWADLGCKRALETCQG